MPGHGRPRAREACPGSWFDQAHHERTGSARPADREHWHERTGSTWYSDRERPPGNGQEARTKIRRQSSGRASRDAGGGPSPIPFAPSVASKGGWVFSRWTGSDGRVRTSCARPRRIRAASPPPSPSWASCAASIASSARRRRLSRVPAQVDWRAAAAAPHRVRRWRGLPCPGRLGRTRLRQRTAATAAPTRNPRTNPLQTHGLNPFPRLTGR